MSDEPTTSVTSGLQASVSNQDPDKIPTSFTFWDVFFWRDAPDWYRKTFLSAGFGLCYCGLKQYLNRHELEVFMPPRAKILPDQMQEGYRNSQMLKYAFLKVGREVTTIAGAAAAYYGGAYYLGRYRGVHSYENFALSGGVAGGLVAVWMIRPFKPRTTAFGVLLGTMLGSAGAYPTQFFGVPFWDETHDFEGYFLGTKIDLRTKTIEGAPTEPSSSPPTTSGGPPSATQSVSAGTASAASVPSIGSSLTASNPSGAAEVVQRDAGGAGGKKSWWRPCPDPIEVDTGIELVQVNV
eukprot:gene6424-3050_t